MGVDRPSSSYRCRWVRDRLPLLAGGELAGADRRKVERHLIACPGCREHEQSLDGAMGVLRAAAGLAPALADGRVGPGPEAPSLWPALARQIREARHEPRVSSLSWVRDLAEPGTWLEAFLMSRPGPRLRPMALAAAVLVVGGLTAAGADAWLRGRVAAADAVVDRAARPVSRVGSLASPGPLAPPTSGSSVVRAEPPPSPGPELPPGARVQYDLDHGTPMGSDAREVMASSY